MPIHLRTHEIIKSMADAATRTGLLAAFTRARQRAEQHMLESERDSSSWREETVSELVWHAARPYVMYAEFNHQQEAAVGADWLWWWVDENGECFGMLVQAKRLFCKGANWSLDFRANKGEQMRRLLTTADHFSVPAAYVLYMGSTNYRASYTSHVTDPIALQRCRKATVSVMAGLLAAQSSASPRDGARVALNESIPLEDLADPAALPEPIHDLNLGNTTGELRKFLLQKQTGARHVARTIFKTVSDARMGMFSLDVAERDHIDSGVVFDDVPLDSAHFGVSYFQHVLRGLRHSPPSYVMDALAGQLPPPSVTDHVGGIVVIHS